MPSCKVGAWYASGGKQVPTNDVTRQLKSMYRCYFLIRWKIKKYVSYIFGRSNRWSRNLFPLPYSQSYPHVCIKSVRNTKRSQVLASSVIFAYNAYSNTICDTSAACAGCGNKCILPL